MAQKILSSLLDTLRLNGEADSAMEILANFALSH
jgi:hypothetical protein